MPSWINDKILFERTRERDIKSFEQLYKRYHPMMFIYSRKFIADPDAVIVVAAAIPSLLWLGSSRQHRNMAGPANFATIVTPKGQRSQLILPDSTKVWINSASSLAYDMSSGPERRLKLSGEAYFEVAKDMNRPFIVETPMLNIKVLGTEFNLISFDEEGLVEATLYEGSIAANSPAGDFEQDILLKPGQRLIYTKAREFEHAETLHDILEVLRMTKRVTYQINGNKVTVNSTNKQ